MSKDTFTKDADDDLDYLFQFNTWLPDGDTISSFTVDISPAAELTVLSSSIVDNSRNVEVWLTGGEVPKTYVVSCQITSAANRKRTKSATFKIDDL